LKLFEKGDRVIVKNPHIQIPRSLLEQFSHGTDEGKKVYVLKLHDKRISEEKIKKLGIGDKGYYPPELEEHFSKIETIFGDVRKEIDRFGKKKSNSITITGKLRQTIFSFMDNMYERGDYFVTQYNAMSKVSKFIGALDKTEFITLRKEMGATRFFSDYLRNTYDCNVVQNRTIRGFVIPRNCFYIYKQFFLMPISPRTAILLMPIDEMSNYLFDDKLSYGFIDDPLGILYLNKHALFSEIELNNDFVAAEKQEDLIDLINFI